jgi:hypothetical protein
MPAVPLPSFMDALMQAVVQLVSGRSLMMLYIRFYMVLLSGEQRCVPAVLLPPCLCVLCVCDAHGCAPPAPPDTPHRLPACPPTLHCTPPTTRTHAHIHTPTHAPQSRCCRGS